MTPPVKPEQEPHTPTYAEWQAAQYGPHRFGQDPTAQLPMGRTPTYAEWQQMQQSANPSALRFPALPTPKFVADQTKRLNPNAGKPDQSLLESFMSPVFSSEPVKKGAAYLDAASAALGAASPGAGSLAAVPAVVGRQVVAPIVEHPIGTAAGIAAAHASPIVVGGLFAADQLVNAAKYGYQYVHEQMMTPEQRAIAQQDPNRISGETAVVQALLAGLTIFGVGSHINQELGFTKTLGEPDPQIAASLRPYVQTPVGATNLGTAAAQHGLPATASPYPPESPLSAAWRDGYEKPRVQVPGTVEQIPTPEAAPTVAEPTVPPAAPTEPIRATTEPTPSGLTPIEGTGETRTRGLATSTERMAVEADITKEFGDLPQYQRVSKADQASKALDFIANDPEAARRVAMGQENPPEGLLSGSVYTALRRQAINEGDAALVHDLATGGFTERATTMGQEISMLGEINPEDPVAAIRAVDKLRGAGAKAGKAIKSAVKDMQKSVEPNLDELLAFFESMKC